MDKSSTRYPYTYACDYMRIAALGFGESSVSRADASAMRKAIAKAIGVDDEELARKIADYYITHEAEIDGTFAKQITAQVLGASA